IFSKYVLRESDSEILQTAMETFAYTCSSPIVPENHPLYPIKKYCPLYV
ncbi:18917_t:CDS:1, partial [Rhizophagus irregularis]